MIRKVSKKLTAISNQEEAVVVVEVVNAETDLKANAEADVAEIVLKVNAVEVKSAAEAEEVTEVVVEEADLELLFLIVKPVLSSNVLNVEVKDKDTKANLVRKTTRSIAKTELVAADVATRREAMARATGVIKHLSQRIAMPPQLRVKLSVRLSQKEERESPEKREKKSQLLLKKK